MPVALLNPAGPAGPNLTVADTDPAWAWAPYQPSAERPWTLALAGHLFRRSGLGATWADLQRALGEGPQRSVERTLQPPDETAAFNRTQDDYESAAGEFQALRPWWLQRMIGTPHPLLEKLTLFWHDHFAVAGSRVQNAQLMRQHLRLLRTHALGSFPALLEAVVVDPAVLLALGAEANRRAVPNEYFARQLLGRFTLGEGQFSDRDVREVARSLTGWFVLRNEIRFFAREHDDAVKTVLGREGNFDSQQIVRILLEQPATARHIVRRLYRWLVSDIDEPNDALIGPLATAFAADYDVNRLVGTILRSNLFFSAAAYRRKVKRPVEFALGIVTGLQANVPAQRLADDLAALGENLYDPPTVNGWAGGRNWINPATVVGRSNLAFDLLSRSGPYGEKLDPVAVANQSGFKDAPSAARFLVDLLLQGDLPAGVRKSLEQELTTAGDLATRLRRLTYCIASLPEFQLA